MVIVAQVQFSYATTNVTSGAWVQLQPLAGNGATLSGGYLTGITPTGGVNSPAATSPSSGPYAMPAEVTEFDVFDSSGQTLLFGVGTSSGSVQQIAIIPPGGPSYPLKNGISKGQGIWLKASGATATGGQFLGTFRHGRR